MIITSSVNDLKMVLQRYHVDEVWAIVRSYKSPINIPGIPVYHVPQLSPSRELFGTYCQMKKAGTWNDEAFFKVYVPKFLSEMLEPSARDKLNLLWKKHNEGKTVVIVCYCVKDYLCHRSIVGGLLQGAGVTVFDAFGVSTNYGGYYNDYMKLKGVQ